ncbi:unnamed protein product [Enterobius vermicularis]|uniref:Pepsin-I3 domain-containing protein n=1 Tax=Enterobius vermicularis TaxID=51028 RepID=A0A0N4V4X4_ENTVE|nr:unnamed protein product [Enterobius vermicularis]
MISNSFSLALLFSTTLCKAQFGGSQNNDETLIYALNNPPRSCAVRNGDLLFINGQYSRRLTRPERRELASYKRRTDRRRFPRASRFYSPGFAQSRNGDFDIGGQMDVVGLLMGQSQDPYSYQNYYNEVNSPYLFYSYNPWLYMRQYSTGSAVPSTAYPTNVGTYNVSPNSYIKPPSFCVT